MYAMKYPLIMDCQPRKIKSETNPILSPELIFNTPGVAIVTQLLINFNHPFPQNLENIINHKAMRTLIFLHNGHHQPCVTWHKSCVRYHISGVKRQVSHVTSSHLSSVMCHMSHVTCLVSHGTFFNSYKVVNELVEGVLSTGPPCLVLTYLKA